MNMKSWCCALLTLSFLSLISCAEEDKPVKGDKYKIDYDDNLIPDDHFKVVNYDEDSASGEWTIHTNHISGRFKVGPPDNNGCYPIDVSSYSPDGHLSPFAKLRTYKDGENDKGNTIWRFKVIGDPKTGVSWKIGEDDQSPPDNK